MGVGELVVLYGRGELCAHTLPNVQLPYGSHMAHV